MKRHQTTATTTTTIQLVYLKVGLALGLCGAGGDGRQLRLVGASVTIKGCQRSVFGCVGGLDFVQHALSSRLHGGNDLR
jgi:hypothetical protein